MSEAPNNHQVWTLLTNFQPTLNHAMSCGLDGAPSSKKTCSNMTPVNVTLFGSRVSADVIKLRWDNTGAEWPYIQYDWCPYEKRPRLTQGQPGTMAMWQQRHTSQCCSWKPRKTKEVPWTPEAGRKDSPLEPSGRALPCQHLDLGSVASRTGRR